MDKRRQFEALHIPGDPLVIFNIWDAGSAKAVADAGAKALATGSASVAGAQGHPDGQAIPLAQVTVVAGQVGAAVPDLPLSVDFEGGYAEDGVGLANNLALLLAEGVVGVNFEDQMLGGSGLYPAERQAARIAALVQAGGPGFFVNARCDLFLKESDQTRHAALVGPALERASAYAGAGASGFFAPGLRDPGLIADLCKSCPLPVNILAFPGMAGRAVLADCGVARISHGPFPWRQAMAGVTEAARAAMA